MSHRYDWDDDDHDCGFAIVMGVVLVIAMLLAGVALLHHGT